MATRKGGNEKLSRSKTVTVRLNPKLHYLAEIAARKQHRSLSSFIEWDVQESLTNVILKDNREDGANISLSEVAEQLWDVDEPDRLIKLATAHPDLLNFNEQLQWKVIRENPEFIKTGKYKPTHIRKHWESIKQRAAGDVSDEEFKILISN